MDMLTTYHIEIPPDTKQPLFIHLVATLPDTDIRTSYSSSQVHVDSS